MKANTLGTVKTTEFADYLVLALSKNWLSRNNGEQLEFDAKLTKEGLLVLSSKLARRDRTKGVDTNVL